MLSINSIKRDFFKIAEKLIPSQKHLVRTRGQCRKHLPAVRVFYLSRMFSDVARGSGFFICFMIQRQCGEKQNTLFLFYASIKHGFWTNQSAHRVLFI